MCFPRHHAHCAQTPRFDLEYSSLILQLVHTQNKAYCFICHGVLCYQHYCIPIDSIDFSIDSAHNFLVACLYIFLVISHLCTLPLATKFCRELHYISPRLTTMCNCSLCYCMQIFWHHCLFHAFISCLIYCCM